MSCNDDKGTPRPGCCEEGVGKRFGFSAEFADDAGEIWRLRYYPGDGNTSLTEKNGKGLVRHCVTEGMISLQR